MSLVIKKASRKQVKLRIGLFGPSGSGKTYSALLLAKGMVGSWENGSADLYSHLGEYSTLTLTAPFDPRRYIEAIKICEREGFGCIVIDSISHEWEGSGGCLEIHSKHAAVLKNTYTAWEKVTPLHNAFLETIIQSNSHIICCGRSKAEMNFEAKKDGGKGKVEKIGMKSITREGFDYEMTLAFQLGQDHLVTTDKDRTTIFSASAPFMISEETGIKIREWNENAPIQKDLTYNNQVIELVLKYTEKGSLKDNLDFLRKNLGFQSSREILEWDEDRCKESIVFAEQVIRGEIDINVNN
jgi:hypothetical protein